MFKKISVFGIIFILLFLSSFVFADSGCYIKEVKTGYKVNESGWSVIDLGLDVAQSGTKENNYIKFSLPDRYSGWFGRSFTNASPLYVAVVYTTNNNEAIENYFDLYMGHFFEYKSKSQEYFYDLKNNNKLPSFDINDIAIRGLDYNIVVDRYNNDLLDISNDKINFNNYPLHESEFNNAYIYVVDHGGFWSSRIYFPNFQNPETVFTESRRAAAKGFISYDCTAQIETDKQKANLIKEIQTELDKEIKSKSPYIFIGDKKLDLYFNENLKSQWGCFTTSLVTTDLNGMLNTLDINKNCAGSDVAAKKCLNLSQGGFNDWYLPTENELYQIALNEKYNNELIFKTVLPSPNNFWSSTSNDGVNFAVSKSIVFRVMYSLDYKRNESNNVICVREDKDFKITDRISKLMDLKKRALEGQDISKLNLELRNLSSQSNKSDDLTTDDSKIPKLSINLKKRIYLDDIVCENKVCYFTDNFRKNASNSIYNIDFKINKNFDENYYLVINEFSEENISRSKMEVLFLSNLGSNTKMLGSNLRFRTDVSELSIISSSLSDNYFISVYKDNLVDYFFFIKVTDEDFNKLLDYKLYQKIINNVYCPTCKIPDWMPHDFSFKVDCQERPIELELITKIIPIPPKLIVISDDFKSKQIEEKITSNQIMLGEGDLITKINPLKPTIIIIAKDSEILEERISDLEIADIKVINTMEIIKPKIIIISQIPESLEPRIISEINFTDYELIKITPLKTKDASIIILGSDPIVLEQRISDRKIQFGFEEECIVDVRKNIIDYFTYFDIDKKLEVVDLSTSSSGYIGANLDPEKTYRFYFDIKYKELTPGIFSRGVYSIFDRVSKNYNMNDNEKAMFFALIGGESSFLANQKGDLKEGTKDDYQSFGPAQININVWAKSDKNYLSSEPNVIRYLNEYFRKTNKPEITTNQQYLDFANTIKTSDENGMILGGAVFLNYLDQIKNNPNMQKYYVSENNQYLPEFVNINTAFILYYGHQIGYPNAEFVINRYQIPSNKNILDIADKQNTDTSNKLNRVSAYGALHKLSWYIFYLNHHNISFSNTIKTINYDIECPEHSEIIHTPSGSFCIPKYVD
jgi:hypothetical protein